MTLKDKIINYLEEKGVKKGTYRIKYYKCSRYQKRYKPEFQEEECWIYPKEVVKEQKQRFIKGVWYNIVDKNGCPIMKPKSGLLITNSDFNSQDFIEMTLGEFKP